MRRREGQASTPFVATDALVLKVRDGGRVLPVHALVATGVNAGWAPRVVDDS